MKYTAHGKSSDRPVHPYIEILSEKDLELESFVTASVEHRERSSFEKARQSCVSKLHET